MYKESAIVCCIGVLLLTVISVAGEDRDNGETGVLELTEDQFYALAYGKIDSLQVSKVKEHQYSALKPVIGVIDPSEPPIDRCWAAFDQFMATNRATFQAWANKHCRPYLSCWCCPTNGLCVTFFVNPTVLCPILSPAKYAQKIRVFEPYLETVRG